MSRAAHDYVSRHNLNYDIARLFREIFDVQPVFKAKDTAVDGTNPPSNGRRVRLTGASIPRSAVLYQGLVFLRSYNMMSRSMLRAWAGLIALCAAASSGPQQVIDEGGARISSAIHDALISSSIIPDVLDDFTPSFSFLLTYPSSHKTIALGNHLPPPTVHSQPVYQFHPLTPPIPSPKPTPHQNSYTIILTDPDAKSRLNPIWSEICHWIVANVSSPDLPPPPPHHHNDHHSDHGTLKPTVLEPYLPPAPPPGTGYHRYVFVLLQGDAASASNISAPAERKHWGYGGERRGVRDWAGEYGLEVVGANFFYARDVSGDGVGVGGMWRWFEG
ncbi:hypothetical protein FQN51_003017 [Onygenales sp. PD_10]|nr:hypothetical protein FQN51_003017 [Onygenales sp. PD_10]